MRSSRTPIPLWIVFAIVLLLQPPFAGATPDETVRWRPVGDDLELGTTRLGDVPWLSPEVTFLRSGLRRFRVGVIPAASFGMRSAEIRVLCEQAKAVACINANFFDEQGNALGLVVSRGVVHSGMHRGGETLTGVFSVSRRGIAIQNRSSVVVDSLVEAVQAGPRLLAKGQPIPDLRERDEPSRRSGLCIDKQGRLVLYVVSSGLFGVSQAKFQSLLQSNSLQCRDALNLDGGGSSQFYFSGKAIGAPSHIRPILVEGNDLVPVALGLFQDVR